MSSEHHKQPDSSEFNTFSPERAEAKETKVFDLIKFEPVYEPGKYAKLKFYKSSELDRKAIVVYPDTEIIPQSGLRYKVEIISDSDESNPMSGKYIGKIIGLSKFITPERWEEADSNVDVAEPMVRHMRNLEREITKSTGTTYSERQEYGNPTDISGEEMADMLQSLKSGYEEDIKSLLGDEGSPERALAKFRQENLFGAVREFDRLSSQREKLRDEEVDLLRSMQEDKEKGLPVTVKRSQLQNIRIKLRDVSRELDEVKEKSPEAYYGIHLLELKKYKKDLSNGRMVETPYVKKNAEEVAEQIRLGLPVFIYGHLGTGKTELAMHVARNIILKNRPDLDAKIAVDFSEWRKNHTDVSKKEEKAKQEELEYIHKSAVVISGSKHFSLAELYGHQVLSIGKASKDSYDKFIEDVETKLSEWEQANQSRLEGMVDSEREGEKQRAHDRIFQTYLKEFESGTVSEFKLGPIYKAMEEGRPLIIDEVNAIPHEALIGLNHILTRRVGDAIYIPGEDRTITIKEGFGVIMTGNLNHGQEKYVHREPLDPAFLSRLHRIEQDYLPQTTEGKYYDASKYDSELFQVILAKVMDKHGNVELPDNGLEELWRLAEVARITQDCFSGKSLGAINSSAGMRSLPYELREAVLSMRSIDAIIRAWTNSEFDKELDFYIWDKFIKQATDPVDRAYLYQTFYENGFFQTEGWQKGAGGDIQKLRNFTVKAPENPSFPIELTGPRDIINNLYGMPNPRKEWPKGYTVIEDPDSPEDSERQF